jgi:benzylmalate synthase
MTVKKIKVFDTTLRDGEQQACINFSQKQKLEIVAMLSDMGMDYIELMPCQNNMELNTVKKIIERNIPLTLVTPLKDIFLEQSMSLNSRIVLFQGVSDDLLSVRYSSSNINKVREKNINNFVESLKKIRDEKGCNIEIFIAGEDSVNADKGYLAKLLKAIDPYIDAFIICDSKGTSNPAEISDLVSFVKLNTDVDIGIHTHNDLGNANANAVEAIKSGASILNGTITGIGERAGNCNIRKVLEELKEDGIIAENLNYDMLDEVESLVYKHAKRSASVPHSPQAFWHETGVHVNALLSDISKGYNAVDPKTLGLEHKVFFGKKSGVSNFKYFFRDHDTKILEKLRDTIKEHSIINNKSYTFEEVMEIIKEKHPDIHKDLKS